MAEERIETWHNGQLVNTETRTYTPPPEQTNGDTLRQRLENAMAGLRTLATSTGTLTGAQLSDGVRLLARAVGAIIRLHLQRLESTD